MFSSPQRKPKTPVIVMNKQQQQQVREQALQLPRERRRNTETRQHSSLHVPSIHSLLKHTSDCAMRLFSWCVMSEDDNVHGLWWRPRRCVFVSADFCWSAAFQFCAAARRVYSRHVAGGGEFPPGNSESPRKSARANFQSRIKMLWFSLFTVVAATGDPLSGHRLSNP